MLELASLRREIERLHRAEYTGENRCWPCTVLNVALVLLVGLVTSRRNRPLGVLAVALGCALVSLRGYVVPGTPRFAPRLVDPLPVDFGYTIPEGVESGSLAADIDPETLMESLAEAGVLIVGEETLYLEETFRDDWEARMVELGELPGSELADRAAAASHEDVDGQFHDERVLLAGSRDVWLSPAIAIAETAAVETLGEWDVPEELRAPAAEPLRTFLRVCPVCSGEVRETTLRNCCGGPGGTQRFPERPVLACEACDTVVFEFDERPV
jgi:hypothetical protein